MATPSPRISSATWERVLQDLRDHCPSGTFVHPEPGKGPATPLAGGLLTMGQLVGVLNALCAQGLLRQTRPTLPLPTPLDLRATLAESQHWEVLNGNLGWMPLPLVLQKMMIPGLVEQALFRVTGSPKSFQYLCDGPLEMELAVGSAWEVLTHELGTRPLLSFAAPATALP